jgi:Tfp pilus assembly protein PilX
MFINLKISKSPNRTNQGFALLIAIVVATIVLTIGISIINTALREVILASTVRNSLSGFYTADSAVECALYWDNVRGRFGTPSAFVAGSSGEIECGGIIVSVTGGNNTGFALVDADLNRPCAEVTVVAVPNGPSEDRVTMRGAGSNTCDPRNSKKVERALRVTYSRFR